MSYNTPSNEKIPGEPIIQSPKTESAEKVTLGEHLVTIAGFHDCDTPKKWEL